MKKIVIGGIVITVAFLAYDYYHMLQAEKQDKLKASGVFKTPELTNAFQETYHWFIF